MTNLNLLRTEISNAERNGDATVVLTIEQARQVIRDAEAMHGGDHVAQVHLDQIARLNEEMARLKTALRVPNKEVDKVASLLPGGE